MDLDELRGAQGEKAISAALVQVDRAFLDLSKSPEAGFMNTDARLSIDRLLEVKAVLLLRLGQRDDAFQLAERLRHSWSPELQKAVTTSEFLEWRWIARSGTKLPSNVVGIDKIRWSNLESCRPERTAEIPFLLRALGGNQAELACDALDILLDHIEHQGTTYHVTPHVARVLVDLLDGKCINIPGLANRVRLALNGAGIFRHVPKSKRDSLSSKRNPIDGLVLGSHKAFKTLRRGVLHGPCIEVLFGGDAEEGSYCEGKRSGPWKFSYKSGAKKAEGIFEVGKKHGTWIEWHENGSKQSDGAWIMGKRDGRWWQGAANGRRFSIGTYKNDRRHGGWEDTWEDGTTKKSEWKNGVQVE